MYNKFDKVLSKSDTISLLEVIHTSIHCIRVNDLKNVLEDFRSLVPFDYSIAGLARTSLTAGITNQIQSYDIININYPSEWLEIYIINRFHEIDPIVLNNFTSYELQFWNDTYRKCNTPKEFTSMARDFGLKHGYTIGLRNLKATEGSLFSFAGMSEKRNIRNEVMLELVSPHLHQAIKRIQKQQSIPKQPELSCRELEILSWLKEGKSSWDISIILNISERTVNFHINNIKQKLDVLNRTQAVAVALETGLLKF